MLKVLCIDDEPDNLALCNLILSTEGHTVIMAADGPAGLIAMADVHPDVIVLDLMMPEMDGWEVYRRKQADPVLREIPVVILTARHDTTSKLYGLQVGGVVDYLCKPFLPSELKQSIEKALAAAGRLTTG